MTKLRSVAATCGLAAAGLGVAVPLLAARARPEYDACSQYISELGENGARHGGLVSLAGFLPTGLLLGAFLALAAPALAISPMARLGLAGFATVPLSYIVAAFARCDPGCPETGSPAQLVHNAFGAFEYLGGGLGLLLLGSAFRSSAAWRPLATSSLLAAAVVFAGFAGMLFLPQLGVRGAFQLGAEAALWLWVITVSLRLLSPGRGLR